jgi:hypothetical protein
MALDHHITTSVANSLSVTLSNHVARYRMPLYLVFVSECRLELELADRRRNISHHGVAAVRIHDADVHEARRLQVEPRCPARCSR